MSPALSANDYTDQLLGYTELISQVLLGKSTIGVKLSYLKNLIACQFAPPIFLPELSFPLSDHVMVIVKLSSKPKVRRSNAGANVPAWAIMKNPFSVRDWTGVQNPTCSVSLDSLAIPRHSALNVSVANRGRSGPKPARFSFLNLSPKSLLEVFGKLLRVEVLRLNVDHYQFSCGRGLEAPTAF